MKIVFIEPAASEANVYSKLHMPLLGPIYLGTILRDRGHKVEIYHEEIYRPDYARLEADLIGVSILTSTARRGYEIAKMFPKEKIIMGGAHASLLPQEALRYARQVVVGEAEEAIADIVEGKRAEPIIEGKAIQELDKLPFPDFSLIKGYRPGSSLVPVSTSRGCPFDCTFCSVTKLFGRSYRFRSAANVLEELRLRDTSKIFFCDDNFAAHPSRTRKLLELMHENKIKNWTCQVRCDITKDDMLLSLMRKGGCSVVCVGFESINNSTLQAYQKKQSLEDIVRSIRAFHKKKIKIHGMFVLGGDDDSERTVWETLKFAIKQKIDTIQMTVLTPLPGTKIYTDLKKQQRIFSHDWNLYDGQHVVFEPKLLSARQLQTSIAKAYACFYSLPRTLLLIGKLHFRNALFRLMGYQIVRQWLQRNRTMHWLPDRIIPPRFSLQ
jgi:radical SAM superfamily enzyme YgiQ (UPF0313 family)